MSSLENSDRHGEAIQASIVRYDDRADQCTLHPMDPDDTGRLTEWITAEEGGYVALACRR